MRIAILIFIGCLVSFIVVLGLLSFNFYKKATKNGVIVKSIEYGLNNRPIGYTLSDLSGETKEFVCNRYTVNYLLSTYISKHASIEKENLPTSELGRAYIRCDDNVYEVRKMSEEEVKELDAK